MNSDNFTPFDSMMDSQSIQLPPNSRRGNIIKQSTATADHAQGHAQSAMDHDKPQVVVHRDGEQIVRIEFICTCGRSSELTLEYDGE